MHTLNQIADWVYSLNPYQLTALTFIVLCVALGVAMIVAFYVLAAKSGAGEGNPEEAETKTHSDPQGACLRSVCAWCDPHTNGPGITHGICPAHAEEMIREAKLTREYGPLK